MHFQRESTGYFINERMIRTIRSALTSTSKRTHATITITIIIIVVLLSHKSKIIAQISHHPAIICEWVFNFLSTILPPKQMIVCKQGLGCFQLIESVVQQICSRKQKSASFGPSTKVIDHFSLVCVWLLLLVQF